MLCSTCMLSLLKNQQSTAFSGYDNTSAQTWASIQKECGVSYPTVAQPPVISLTAVLGFANSSYSAPCLSGNTYTVKSEDNCEAIAEVNKVATGTLITINQLLPTCTDLYIGQSLCLPQTCTAYKVRSGHTCNSITSSDGISLLQLQTWNPSLNQACTNLLSGTNICVGIPGGQMWNGTTIAGATTTQTAAYATATVAPQGATAAGTYIEPEVCLKLEGYYLTINLGTTAKCGEYYKVQSGDICQLVALNNTISIALFEAINPSINSDCTNLVPGLYYCVFPTANWNVIGNATTATTTVAAPAPTTSGKFKSGLNDSEDRD